MSYARDEKSIKANAKAYAQYRSKVKYGTLRSEADDTAVQALISGTTEEGRSRGGFDHAANNSGQSEMGSHADEINYRINKNGTFTMDDYKDMTTMGGRVNDQGVLVRKNAGDIKTRHGHGPGSMSHTANAIDDMIHNSNMGGKDYKFDQNVIDYVAGKRKEVDDKKARETAAKERKQQAIREDNERRRKEAPAQGKPSGSSEEAASKPEAENEEAADEGKDAVQASTNQRSQQAKSRAMQFQMRSAMRKNNQRRAQSNNVNTFNNQGEGTQTNKYDFKAAANSSSPESWKTRSKNVGRFG